MNVTADQKRLHTWLIESHSILVWFTESVIIVVLICLGPARRRRLVRVLITHQEYQENREESSDSEDRQDVSGGEREGCGTE